LSYVKLPLITVESFVGSGEIDDLKICCHGYLKYVVKFSVEPFSIIGEIDVVSVDLLLLPLLIYHFL
jgi:hypothetical protein